MSSTRLCVYVSTMVDQHRVRNLGFADDPNIGGEWSEDLLGSTMSLEMAEAKLVLRIDMKKKLK